MKLIILPSIALALSSAANAAECYAQCCSQRCASWDGLWQFREWFCTQEWQGESSNKLYNDGNGFSARFSHTGAFGSQQQCWDSTADIINHCFGKKDGGTYTVTQFSMNINFCA